MTPPSTRQPAGNGTRPRGSALTQATAGGAVGVAISQAVALVFPTHAHLANLAAPFVGAGLAQLIAEFEARRALTKWQRVRDRLLGEIRDRIVELRKLQQEAEAGPLLSAEIEKNILRLQLFEIDVIATMPGNDIAALRAGMVDDDSIPPPPPEARSPKPKTRRPRQATHRRPWIDSNRAELTRIVLDWTESSLLGAVQAIE